MTTQIDDLSRSLVAFEQDTTLIAAVELSQSSWLVGAMVPGLERQPAEEARTELVCTARAARALAGRRSEDGPDDPADRGGFRGQARPVLGGALAAPAWGREPRHSLDQRRSLPRAQAQDRVVLQPVARTA